MTRLPSVLGAIALLGFVAAQDCTMRNNLPYCNSVKAITYANIGASGTYQDVVGYDGDSCTCPRAPKSFDGPLAPLDEQLSIHFRGPIKIKQVAVYSPGAPKKRSVKRHAHHIHQKRAVVMTTETITSTITVYPPGETKPAGYEDAPALIKDVKPKPPKAPKAPKAPKEVEEVEDVAKGEWQRKGIYQSEAQVMEGLVVMNHKGGDKSGVFDYCTGNSISFSNEEGTGGAAEPTILKDKTMLSNEELVMFSDEKCDDSCGFVRPGVPNYKGFGGKQKIFLFEFSMPSHTDGADFNKNIPAIWFLNAKIPRMAQYGKQAGGDGKTDCSCWETGCGELDVFEVLVGAEDYVKTHYHSKQGAIGGYGGGGSPDFFDRPYDGTVKAAVIFDGSKDVTITFLDQDTTFPVSFGEAFVQKCTGKGPGAKLMGTSKKTSVFNVPS